MINLSTTKLEETSIPGGRWRRFPAPLMMFLTGFLIYVIAVLPILVINHGLFFLYGDYNVQQVPFYMLAHRAVRNGEFFWNWNLDLGGTLIGDLSFYLMGSPFFWLTIPFPESAVPYLMPFLMALKYATCATTAYLYFRTYKIKDLSARIGGFLYAFSGFNGCNIVFNHFTDAVAFFPLLLLTFDSLMELDTGGEASPISHGYTRWLRFTLCVSLLAIINYYFFFGMVVFLFLYAVIRYARGRSLRTLLSMIVRALSGGIIGVLIAALFLMLALSGIAGNTRLENVVLGYDMIVYPSALMYLDILKSMVMVSDIIGKGTILYDATVKNASLAVFLPFFGLSGVLSFFRAYQGRKNWIKTLLWTCLLIALVPVLNSVFSLFNSWYYARWYFMPILFMALVTVREFEKEDLTNFRTGTLISTLLFTLMLVIYCLPTRDESGKIVFFQISENKDYFIRNAIATACMYVGLILLCLLVRSRKRRLRIGLLLTCLSSLAATMIMLINGMSLVNHYGMQMWKQQMLDSKPDTLDPNVFYRVETEGSATNYEMVWGMPTIHCFLSTVPAEIFNFYSGTIGFTRTVESNPPLRGEGLRAILSEKYYLWNHIISSDGEYGKGMGTYGFTEIQRDTGETEELVNQARDRKHGFRYFENKNFIPMGFVFRQYIYESEFDKLDKNQTDRALVKALILPDDTPKKYTEQMIHAGASDMTAITSDDEFDEECRNRAATSCTSFRTIHEKRISIKTGSGKEKTFSSYGGGFQATTSNLENRSLVYFSVPNLAGWKVYVDGREGTVLTADYGMMAVDVPKGIHEITALYQPPYLRAGLVASLSGILFAILYGVFCKVEKKRERGTR